MPDTTPPTVSSITRVGTSPTNAASVQFTVTFNESVTGVDATDFALTTSGVTGAGVSGVSGSGTTYIVTVNTGTSDGTIRLDVTDDDSIVDGEGNKLGGTGTSGAGDGSFITGEEYLIDKTAPTVGISPPSQSTANASSTVTYTVTYADANFSASTLAAGNIIKNTTGTADATVGVSGSGTTRTVTLSGITGHGTFGISIPAGTASDTAGNLAPAAGRARPSRWMRTPQRSNPSCAPAPTRPTPTPASISPLRSARTCRASTRPTSHSTPRTSRATLSRA